MRYNRVFLIQPSYAASHYNLAMRPLAGIGYIAETLKTHDITYDVLDMELGYNLEHLKEKIDEFKPDLIGISMMTFKYKDTYRLIHKIKIFFPNIHTVAGGPHISVMREVALQDCSDIDYGIVLEGEETFIELCKGEKELSKIDGLIHREESLVHYNGDRKFIENLDKVPFPTYETFELDKYNVKEICIVSSRGCPYNCIYCPGPLAIGKKFRVRSANNVVDEIEYWYKRGYRKFDFVDDNFTLYKNRVYQICDEIEQRGLKNLELHCGNGIRADKVDRNLLKKMHDVGFNYIAFGVEGGNNKILKNLKKGETIEVIEEGIKNACELGFDVSLFFLLGSPGETCEDIKDSVNLALRYPIIDVRFYNIIPYPRTEIWDWLQKNNYLVRQPEEFLSEGSGWVKEPIFSTPELPLDKRKKAMQYTRSIEKLVKKRKDKQKLKKFGIIGRAIVDIYYVDTVQNLLSSHPFVREIIRSLKSKLGI